MLANELPNHRPVTIEFNQLTYHVKGFLDTKKLGGLASIMGAKKEKTILKSLSGTFKPGELTAIMGPSGAGKSTLMNILAGYKNSNVEGDLMINGEARDMSTFRKMSCYIMQDDVLLPHLTVFEAMNFAAQLKLSRRTTNTERFDAITRILESIGLMRCKNVRTGNISGGERKRLAIALELINNPPIMFFDEPTSGLDSSSCYSCVSLLKELAKGGRTIITTIHQPSARIFELFDSLYVLGEGKNLYRGQISSFVPHFARQGLQCPSYHNPADFAIEVAIGDYGEEWIDKLSRTAAAAATLPMNTTKLADIPEGKILDENNYCSSPPLPPIRMDPPANHHVVHKMNKKKERHCSTTIDLESSEKLLDKSTHATTTSSSCNGNGDHDFDHTNLGKNGSGNTTANFVGYATAMDDDYSCFGQFCHQFFVLLRRSFLCIYRDMILTNLRLGATIMIGLLSGATFQGVGSDASKCLHNAGFIFFSLIFLVLSGMMLTVLTFPLERGVLTREHMNSWYALKPYFLARSLADLPFQLFFPFLYVLITYYMTDQSGDGFRFCLLSAIGVLVSVVAQSFGLLCGAFFSLEIAIFLAPILTIPWFLYAGFLVSVAGVPSYLRWLSWLSYVRYAFQSMLTTLYGFDRKPLPCPDPYCHFKNPDKFLETLQIVDVSVIEYMIYLGVTLIIFRFLAYWALRTKIVLERH